MLSSQVGSNFPYATTTNISTPKSLILSTKSLLFKSSGWSTGNLAEFSNSDFDAVKPLPDNLSG